MSDEKTVRVQPEVLAAHLEGEAVLLHMDTKDYFRLNDTAAFVWKALERGKGRDEVLADMLAAFDVEPAEAESELDRLLAELTARKLVSEA